MTGGFLNLLADAAASDPHVGLVVGLGIGMVFVGLIGLILIISIMNVIFGKIKTKEPAKPDVPAVKATGSNEKMDPETVAAVSAAIAEVLGRDVSGIRITSIKKVN